MADVISDDDDDPRGSMPIDSEESEDEPVELPKTRRDSPSRSRSTSPVNYKRKNQPTTKQSSPEIQKGSKRTDHESKRKIESPKKKKTESKRVVQPEPVNSNSDSDDEEPKRTLSRPAATPAPLDMAADAEDARKSRSTEPNIKSKVDSNIGDLPLLQRGAKTRSWFKMPEDMYQHAIVTDHRLWLDTKIYDEMNKETRVENQKAMIKQNPKLAQKSFRIAHYKHPKTKRLFAQGVFAGKLHIDPDNTKVGLRIFKDLEKTNEEFSVAYPAEPEAVQFLYSLPNCILPSEFNPIITDIAYMQHVNVATQVEENGWEIIYDNSKKPRVTSATNVPKFSQTTLPKKEKITKQPEDEFIFTKISASADYCEVVIPQGMAYQGFQNGNIFQIVRTHT